MNFGSLVSKQVLVRLTSSFLMAVPVIAFILVGGVYFIVFVALLAGIMSWEVTRTVCKPRNDFIEIGIVFVVAFLVIVFGLFFCIFVYRHESPVVFESANNCCLYY